ncbi:MAG: DUF732 domain-containing protein [Fuerstiella sp.]|nr:DUF732 domain-containing protein [Fuerstiella sp.]
MEKKIIAAGLGIIALTATGCAVAAGEAKEVTPEPTVTQEPSYEPEPDYTTPGEDYVAYLYQEGVPLQDSDAEEAAVSLGWTFCDSFKSLGAGATMVNAFESNQTTLRAEADELAAIVYGTVLHLCPQHRDAVDAAIEAVN